MNPIAIAILAAGAYASQGYYDGMTYSPAGISEPKIAGFDARMVGGAVGVGLSLMSGGILGLLGAGIGLGSLMSYQSAQTVGTTYKLAVTEFQNAQLASQAPSRFRITKNPTGRPAFLANLGG